MAGILEGHSEVKLLSLQETTKITDIEEGNEGDEEDREVDHVKLRDAMLDLIVLYGNSGAPAHRVEAKFRVLSTALNVSASILCYPHSMQVSFDEKPSSMHIVSLNASIDLGRIEEVEGLVKGTQKHQSHGRFLREARHCAETTGKRQAFPTTVVWIARLISGPLAVAVFFNGGWADMLASFGLSFIVLLLSLFSYILGPTYTKIYPTLACFVVAFLTRVVTVIAGGSLVNVSCVRAIELGTIVDFLPGISISQSVLELAANSSISGTVRLAYSVLMAFFLGFGLAYGNLLADQFAPALPENPICSNPLVPYWFILFLPLQLLGYAIQLSAPWKRMPWMFVSGVVAFIVPFGFMYIPNFATLQGLETTLAAFAVGICGGASEKLSQNRTSSMSPIVAGMLLLVPGSIAVLSLTNTIMGNVSSGLAFGTRFLFVAVSICIGLFFSAVIFVIPIKRGMHHKLSSPKFLL